MTLTRRRFVAATAATAFAASTGPVFAQQKPIRVGYIADFFGASLTAIANDQGLWAKHGLTPDIKVFTNGPIQIQALGAGSLDVGYIGPGALWLPASGKAKIVAINAIGFSDRVTRLFSNAQPLLATGRNLGLLGLDLLPPAKRWFARQAMGLGARPV